jgi:hypothetical protein
MQRLLPIILLSALAGCAIPDKGIIEASTPPVVTPAGISPGIIEVNKISQHFDPDDPVDTTIVVLAIVTDQDGMEDILATSALLSDPEGRTLSTSALSDAGIYPDLVANDGLYSAKIRLTTTKKQIGNYSLQLQATDRSNQKSNIVYQQVALKNTANDPPILSSLTLPDSAIIPTGQDSTIVKIVVMVSDSQGRGDIVSVTGTLKLPDGSIYLSFSLYDDGGNVARPPFNVTSGDSAANDGRFTTRLLFVKKSVGNYMLRLQAKDLAQALSNAITKTFYVRNAFNHGPVLSNPVMPDTVTVPTGTDTTFIKVSVTVFDQEGLGDIAGVTFTSQRPDSSVVAIYPMYDDGGGTPQPPFNLRSGDSSAGDGIFTTTIPLTSSAQGNTYRDFIFQATDRAGEKSPTISKRIHIR